MKPAVTLALLAFALQALPATAHDLWLEPSSTVLSRGAYITVAAAAGNDKFHYNHAPLRALEEQFSALAPDGQRVAPENLMQGKLRTVFDLKLEGPGTYRLATINRAIVASWKEGGEPRRFRGDAAALAREVPADAEALRVYEGLGRLETFVTVGQPTELPPSGIGLELRPITHPNDLFAGETAHFQFEIDGKPAAGLTVTVVAGGARYRNQPGKQTLTTDDQGRLSVTWPHAGLFWLGADWTDDQTTVAAARERRLSYTATLEVLPD